jgi:protein-S-isoprenylcysteine O-methyltransferase Ste14
VVIFLRLLRLNSALMMVFLPGLALGETARVPGRSEPVEIVQDRWGISHIYAKNESDLFLVQGYNAARDRLFQLELWRMQASGTASAAMATLLRIVVLATSGFLTLQLGLIAIRSRTSMVGRAPIHFVLFYLAKICLCISFAFLILEAIRPERDHSTAISAAIMLLLLAGIGIMTISFVTLGRSLRMGLAEENTALVTRGIYQWSRNPIYVGVSLMLFASLLFAFSWVNAAVVAAGIFLHHRIILSEERDLSRKFPEYDSYRQAVRRYI